MNLCRHRNERAPTAAVPFSAHSSRNAMVCTSCPDLFGAWRPLRCCQQAAAARLQTAPRASPRGHAGRRPVSLPQSRSDQKKMLSPSSDAEDALPHMSRRVVGLLIPVFAYGTMQGGNNTAHSSQGRIASPLHTVHGCYERQPMRNKHALATSRCLISPAAGAPEARSG